MLPGSLRLGNIVGIDISLHVSWILIVVFLTWSLATGWFAIRYPGWAPLTYWVVSLVATLLLFLSVLAHELAHALVAQARGLPVRAITLFLFGGISTLEQEPQRPGVEWQMAIVGPLTSLFIGGLASLVLILLHGGTSPLAAVVGYLGIANLLLGCFNLLPAFPLDGGRVLRSLLWAITGSLRTATRIATLAGEIIAYALILSGLWLVLERSLVSGLWLAFIGWFLLNGAQAANTQAMLEALLKGVTVDQCMETSVATTPATISLQNLISDLLLPREWRSAFVVEGDRLVGLVTLKEIRHIPQQQWATIPVDQVMVPLKHLAVVSPRQGLREVFSLMVNQDVNQVPVVEEGRLVGVVSREHLLRFLEIRRSLGMGMEAPNKAKTSSGER